MIQKITVKIIINRIGSLQSLLPDRAKMSNDITTHACTHEAATHIYSGGFKRFTRWRVRDKTFSHVA